MLLSIQNLSFSYDESISLFDGLSLNIDAQKFIALVGESGSGKTTLLQLIYGLHAWDRGKIYFNGKALLGPKGNLVPGEKDMQMVAQDFALTPYATVFDNVGKFISNIDLNQKRNRVDELLHLVDLSQYAQTRPKDLSGGQQQRVAIARALSTTPRLLLLDEPFSNVDVSRKLYLREKIFSYCKKQGIALMISTHHLTEVLPWMDQVFILQKGNLVQRGTPKDIYMAPQNAYVANLFGEVNVLDNPLKMILKTDKNYVFPHEVKIAQNGVSAKVMESRFGGGYYWNKIRIGSQTLIMYSQHALSGDIEIFIA